MSQILYDLFVVAGQMFDVFYLCLFGCLNKLFLDVGEVHEECRTLYGDPEAFGDLLFVATS